MSYKNFKGSENTGTRVAILRVNAKRKERYDELSKL